ncbi:hypothetical protein CTI12_AA207040 [Artemisia annua]|uniref:Uncharacterized protein n=1 Tax=Artemisia annua TaxID=35608 RepID=A0A2U1P0H3_ARTAN|nr:hypothetical protein CTI12_AA207040 [Artemisia annua]
MTSFSLMELMLFWHILVSVMASRITPKDVLFDPSPVQVEFSIAKLSELLTLETISRAVVDPTSLVDNIRTFHSRY